MASLLCHHDNQDLDGSSVDKSKKKGMINGFHLSLSVGMNLGAMILRTLVREDEKKLQTFKNRRNPQMKSRNYVVIPDFKDKTRYTLYMSFRSQFSYIATNKG